MKYPSIIFHFIGISLLHGLGQCFQASHWTSSHSIARDHTKCIDSSCLAVLRSEEPVVSSSTAPSVASLGMEDILSSDDLARARDDFDHLCALFPDLPSDQIQEITHRYPILLAMDKVKFPCNSN
jgi:hypothetical protein